MPRALIDTSVLFAAVYSRDSRHDDALPILRGVDDGSLPEGIVLDYVLVETVNGLQRKAGSDAARDFLGRVEENTRFHVDRLASDGLAGAKSLFRQYGGLSLVDASLLSYAERHEVEFLYAFDADFDVDAHVRRITEPIDPYAP